jgi:chromosome segregation ATPase
MSELERSNLEAHVDLCAERYKRLEEKFETLDLRLGTLKQEFALLEASMDSKHKELVGMIQESSTSRFKVLVATSGTVIAAILSVLGYLIVNIKH